MAGALIGALAGFVVAAFSQLALWMRSSDFYASTWAPQGVDLWTYFSMARAVWRSTSGITYSYPYSLYWLMPEVIFQLPITLLAWLGRITGLPLAFETGRIAGAAGTGASIGAIGALFPPGFWRRWFYIAAVLGGGLFSFATVILAIDTAGLDGLTELYQYQPKAEGRLFWWLPFLGRNLRMPLECLYHAMVIGALACLVWKRYWCAWALGAVVWMSNPFSAVALHAAVLPWMAWGVAENKGAARRGFIVQLVAWLLLNAAAALYYGWYLNRWPLMQELRNMYQSHYLPPLEWWRLFLLVMPYGSALLMTILIASWRRAVWGRPIWRLFALLAVVHILLIQQGAVLGEHSMQSYHYNRGYLHLGLVVVFWRVLVLVLHRYHCLQLYESRGRWMPWKINSLRCRRAAIMVSMVVVVSMIDQVNFAAYAVFNRSFAGLLERDYVELVRQIPATPAPMLVLTESVGIPGSYITGFTPHVSWDADETMVVPYWNSRKRWAEEAMEGQHGGVSGLGIDYAVLYANNSNWINALELQGWTVRARGEYLQLMRAPKLEPGLNPPPPESID